VSTHRRQTNIISTLHNCITILYLGARWPVRCVDGITAFGVRSRKLSNVILSSDGWPILSQAPPCFGKDLKSLVPAAYAVFRAHRSYVVLCRDACLFGAVMCHHHHHHHQPIKNPPTGAKLSLERNGLDIRRTGHNPPGGPTAIGGCKDNKCSRAFRRAEELEIIYFYRNFFTIIT
jgi:hypothetical protein